MNRADVIDAIVNTPIPLGKSAREITPLECAHYLSCLYYGEEHHGEWPESEEVLRDWLSTRTVYGSLFDERLRRKDVYESH